MTARVELRLLAEQLVPAGTGFANRWNAHLAELSREWDAAEPGRHDDLAWTAQVLFDDLDRLQLAVWAEKLLPPESPLRADLAGLVGELTAAEETLFERPSVFVDRFPRADRGAD